MTRPDSLVIRYRVGLGSGIIKLDYENVTVRRGGVKAYTVKFRPIPAEIPGQGPFLAIRGKSDLRLHFECESTFS